MCTRAQTSRIILWVGKDKRYTALLRFISRVWKILPLPMRSTSCAVRTPVNFDATATPARVLEGPPCARPRQKVFAWATDNHRKPAPDPSHTRTARSNLGSQSDSHEALRVSPESVMQASIPTTRQGHVWARNYLGSHGQMPEQVHSPAY
jgi:hypothetical protein